MRLARTKHLLPASVALAALILSACGSDAATTGTSSSNPASGSLEPNTFLLDEWSVMAPAGEIQAGKVTITAINNGKEPHELVIVRASDAASLPTKADGSLLTKADGSVNEDKIPDTKKAGEIGDLGPGKTATKTLNLLAGDYLAFCNIVEDMSTANMGSGDMGDDHGMSSTTSMGTGTGMHVHYKLGMIASFTVK